MGLLCHDQAKLKAENALCCRRVAGDDAKPAKVSKKQAAREARAEALLAGLDSELDRQKAAAKQVLCLADPTDKPIINTLVLLIM